MATNKQLQNKIAKLEAENRRLVEENKLKKSATKKKSRSPKSILRKTGVVFFVSFAVALLLAGNLLFWTGNTVVKTDRYIDSVAPVIKDQEVQNAIARYTTAKIYQNIDVATEIQQVLPPRADFLAPTLADQLQSRTDDVFRKVLASPKFQQKWIEVQEKSHARFIDNVTKYGDDGTIDISEVYTQLSSQLKGTKLSFLADKQLPDKVGSIEVVKGPWLSTLHRVITHIDLWRFLAILLFLLSAATGVWLSRNRRKTIVITALLSATGMFFTLATFRVAREVVADKVNPDYAEAVRHTFQIIFHPLVIQTATIMSAMLVVAFTAWLSGTSKAALSTRARFSDLFSGKLHASLFKGNENSFTLFVGRNKRAFQWTSVAVVGLVTLFTRLTPKALLVDVILVLLLVSLIEVLSSPTTTKSVRAKTS